MANADKAYINAQEHGLNIALDIRSEAWGQRHFSIKDPNGIFIDVVEAIEPSQEYQSGYETE